MTAPSKPGRRLVRRLGIALSIVVGVTLVLAVAALAALRSHAVRLALLGRASGALERSMGVRISAGDIVFALADGRIELVEPRLAVGGESPFLFARRVVVEVEIGSLWRPPLLVRQVVVEAPVVDLAAPLPRPTAAAGGATEPAGPPPRLERVRVTEGAIRGGSVPEAARRWLDGWSVDELEATGSLLDGVLSLVLGRGRVQLSRTEPGTDVLHVAVTVTGPLSGPLRVSNLSVVGDGVRLAGDGEVVLDPEIGVAAVLDLDAQPDRIVPSRGVGGTVRVSGPLSSNPIGARLTLTASDLAVDAVRPLVGAAVLELLGAESTSVDVEALLEVAGDLSRPAGSATVSWRRAGEMLAQVDLELVAGGDGVVGGVDARLLPETGGERSLHARVAARDLAGLAAGRIEEAKARVEADDLLAEVRSLRAHWPLLVPEMPAEVDLAGQIAIDATAVGSLADPQVQAEGSWCPTRGGSVHFAGLGRPGVQEVRARLTLADVPMAVAGTGFSGSVSGDVTVEGAPASWTAAARLDGRDLVVGSGVPTVDSVHLEASSDGKTFEIASLVAAAGPMGVEASGHGALALPVIDVVLDVSVTRPIEQVERAVARITLAGGTVQVSDGVVESPAGTAFVALEVPLGTLAELPAAADVLRDLPFLFDRGPVHVSALVPDVDSCRLSDAFGLPDRAESGRGDLALELWVDPAQPALATGHLIASNLEAVLAGRRVVASSPLRIRVGQAEARIEPFRILVAGTGVEMSGTAALRADWHLEDAPESLVTEFDGRVSGRVETAILEPYLVGAVATGSLLFDATASGRPEAPHATFSLRGDGASFTWATPYPLRVSQPVFEGSFAEGALTLWSGEMGVNSGTVALRGTLATSGRGELQVELEALRLRLDYGLRTVVSGDMVLTLWPDERPLLSGTIVVARGVLDRNLDLEREVLGQFMAPVVTAGTEDNPLDRVDLDLAVVTTDGVRVKNNLADLTARWDRLEVGGTAWNPLIRGAVSIDPGGLAFAYGQTVRIDRGELQFTGDPIADPRIELTTTGSWQDASIRAPGQDSSPFGTGRAEEGVQVLEAFSTGIAGYYGERVASRIGESLGLGKVSLRPVLVFGETDPSARLTISRDLSRSVAVAVSLDLRNTQRQTYVLDVRDLPKLGAFRAQAFTNDAGHEGASLQQVLELGGSRVPDSGGPLLDRVVWEAPDQLSRRVLKRAVNFERGKPLPDGAAFDLEIELEHELRRAGWPAAVVSVVQRPSTREGRVDLVGTVDSGPKVRFEFTGDRPPKGLRPGITDLYRPGTGEAATLEEVRKQTVRVLRSAGYLDPEVDVSAHRAGSEEGPVVVTVDSRGGVRAELGPPLFMGVPDEVGFRLAERFPGAVERAELALGLGDANRRALAALHEQGYPHARLVSRSMTLDGRELVVVVEPGPLQKVAAVVLDGVSDEQHDRLSRLLAFEAGDPLRRDRIARGAAAIEEDLRARGYARGAVRASLEAAADDELSSVVRYEVRTGQRYELASVTVVGNRWTGERAVRRMAALELGAPYRTADIAAARSRLMRAGIYSRVVAATELGDGGAQVELQVVERPRFQLAYGFRYESDVGTSAVVDFLDRNLLGRGVTAGVRLRWEPDDRSGRLFMTVPGVLGFPVSVETYGERRREVRGGLIRDVGEGALQLSLGLGRSTTGRVYARYRDTKLSEVEPDPFFPFEVRITHPYLGVQLVHDRRDDLLQPSSGVLATLDVSGSGSFIGSDFRYLRGYGQVNLYRAAWAFVGRPVIWAQSYRVGLAHAFDQDLIPDVRFYAGGEFSLRGYPTEGVGPVDELGSSLSPAGGAAVLVVNQELRLALPWDLVGVGFVDVGGVWADLNDFGTDLVKALGVGLRASTPVGVLRLDLAVPLDRREWEPRYKLYIGFGNAF